MTNRALLIFTRNPVLGQCKTRLAKTIGDKAALDIYKFLLAHTAKVTSNLDCDVFVYYDNEIWTDDVWDDHRFFKKLQEGDDLGSRMHNAFKEQFEAGYKHLICIGSDLYDLTTADLTDAFKRLESTEAIMGPALDGGYYLIGLNKLIPRVFKNKVWGTDTVAKETLRDLAPCKYELLDTKNDIDYYQDMKDIEALMVFVPTSLQL